MNYTNEITIIIIAFFLFLLIAWVCRFVSFWIITKSYRISVDNPELTSMTMLLFLFLNVTLTGALLYYFIGNYISVLLLVVGTLASISIIIKPSIIELFIRSISLDFYFADYYKQEFEDDDEKKGKIVKYFNSSNLIVSILFFSCLSFLTLLDTYDSIIVSSPILKIFTFVIIFRISSRSFELMYAFCKDVVIKKDPSTNLTKYDRIQLAIKSYIELALTNACLYFLSPIVNLENTVIELNESLIKSIGIQTFTNVNLSDSSEFTTIKYFIYLQVFTSLSLIVLSLAVYASRVDTKVPQQDAGDRT